MWSECGDDYESSCSLCKTVDADSLRTNLENVRSRLNKVIEFLGFWRPVSFRKFILTWNWSPEEIDRQWYTHRQSCISSHKALELILAEDAPMLEKKRRRDLTCQEMTGRNQPGSQERNCNYTVSRVLAPPYIKPENSGPLGLLRFAVTTFVFCLYGVG